MSETTNHDNIPDAWRQAAREEARAVYDDLATEDSEGRVWNVESIITTFGITRRQALMTLALIATGVPVLSAVTRAAGESWGNATGTEGTDSEPLDEVNVRQLDAQDIFAESVDAGALNLTPLVDETFVLSGAQTVGRAITGASVGDRIVATAVPNEDPDNNLGATVDEIFWNDAAGEVRARISETENDGGGTVRFTAWKVGV